MMRYLLAVLLVTVCAFPAYAEGPALFKEFSYGQPRAEVEKLPGVLPCDEIAPGALCRQNQSFAGSSDWLQAFVFDKGKLSMVALAGPASGDSYTKVVGVMTNNGFIPTTLQSGDKMFDMLKALPEKGEKAAIAELTAFEAAALNGDAGLTYTFIPKDALKGAAKYGSYAQFVFNAPESLRATELELAGDEMFVRFIAPRAALNDMKQQMESQKESF
ncbi:MAG: hypothetical protein K2N07_06440 [Desulfovibrio sp.]|nr:hypothetical protein [Desulfovibrio sp.]